MAERSGATSPSPTEPGSGDASLDDALSRQSPSVSSGASATEPQEPPARETEADAEDHRPRAKLTVRLGEASARRGTPLQLSGSVRADGEACAFSRVDVSLNAEGVARAFIGALPADEQGNFSGQVTIPLSVDVGDYSLSVSTPGTADCAPSE
jgi:hypothetical protein